MKKKSNNAFYAGVTVIIVISSFLYTWKFIIPKFSDNKSKSAQLDVDISSASKKLDSLKKAQTTLTQLGDIPTQLSVAVPEDKDMPNLITELEAIAAKYKIVLPTISVNDSGAAAAGSLASSTPTSPNAVTIDISAPGSFEGITGLIADLEKDIRFMNIKTVSITSTKDDTGTIITSVSLQIEAYKRGASAAASTALPTGASTTP
ncbi:MAG: type 4a pilus biogenesis protein PilO [Dehalococcoidales bacterium]|nr:type 4a pilus biogenesis protein PilO [Dehalococcoidales bacterium]